MTWKAGVFVLIVSIACACDFRQYKAHPYKLWVAKEPLKEGPRIRRGLDEQARTTNDRRLELMHGAEFAMISAAKGNPYSRQVGLALSGGGVRSASYASGALVGLYEIGLIDRIGYLSSVSGGGYAAGWWMFHGSEPDPNGEVLARGSPHLFHLSQYGSYLSVGHNSGSPIPSTAEQFLWPLGWVVNSVANIHANFIFDWETNTSYQKTVYRRGLARAFLYDEPGMRYAYEVRAMNNYPPSAAKPFWIINMHLSLLDDGHAYKARSGDAFELTPLRGGSDSIGYVAVSDIKPGRFGACNDYGRRPPVYQAPFQAFFDDCFAHNYWMSPRYAIAISGAAVDRVALDVPGAAIARLTNSNMGYFVDGWGADWLAVEGKDPPWFAAANVRYAVPAVPFYLLDPQHGRKPDAARHYLTDGGHFENTGVYALVRRGVRLIIVSDSAQDAAVDRWCQAVEEEDHTTMAEAFEDLKLLEQRLYTDFGVTVIWHWEELCNPAGNYVFWGQIRSLPVSNVSGSATIDEVRIVYVKAAANLATDGIRSEGSFVDLEKARNKAFPNETTANQFFTEQQVVAHQELARQQITQGSRGYDILRQHFHWLCEQQGAERDACFAALVPQDMR